VAEAKKETLENVCMKSLSCEKVTIVKKEKVLHHLQSGGKIFHQ
jgi:hypothetical protein